VNILYQNKKGNTNEEHTRKTQPTHDKRTQRKVYDMTNGLNGKIYE